MFGFVWRQAKRLFVLLVGIATIWVIVRRIFPWLDNRLPLLFAITLTYVLGAYAVIPLVIRGLRWLFPARHIPLYTTTPDGFACDPVNIGIVGSERSLKRAMKAAGWTLADPRTPSTMLKLIAAFLFNRPYASAPFSTLYLFGRRQDLGFQQHVKGSARARHHVRFWSCSTESRDIDHQRHVQFWRGLPHIPDTAEQLWVGAATKDIGLGIILHNAQFTHAIAADTNAERDYIVESLEKVHAVRKTKIITAGQPYTLTNRSLGITMVADGDLFLVHLK